MVKKFGTFDLGHVSEFWDVLGIKRLGTFSSGRLELRDILGLKRLGTFSSGRLELRDILGLKRNGTSGTFLGCFVG